ncbi:MAG: HGGxSTG domain-containing protein [Hyphomicrobium sp.]
MQRQNCQPLALCQCQKCGARTRSGSPCRSPSVSGKARCRMHGGAANSGAPRGERNGAYRNGAFTREAIADRQMISALVAECRLLVKSLL